MLLFNDLDPDPRVFKAAIALSDSGYHVEILAARRSVYERKQIAEHAFVDRIFPHSFYPVKYPSGIRACWRYGKRTRGEFDFIHCHDAETLPFGFFLRLFNRKAKMIYDAHEYIRSYLPLPEPLIKKIGFSMTFGLYSLFERVFITKADAVISVSESLTERFKKDYNLKSRVLCLFNVLNPVAGSRDYLYERFAIERGTKIIIFTGTIGPSREIENLVRVLRHLSDEFCLVLLGTWSSAGYRNRVLGLIEKGGLSKRVFEGFVPYRDLVHSLAAAALSIFISNPSTLTLKYSMPNKLWESIAAGVPFVANAELVEMSRFIKEHDIGVVADSTDPEQIAEEIRSIFLGGRYELIRKNVSTLRTLVNWDHEKMRLIDLYRSLEIS
jgi:glycosyltransferase involved in cell wall biosynthesis